MGRDKTGSIPKGRLKAMSLSEAPRSIAGLAVLPRTLRYRLALAAGLEPEQEMEFIQLPAVQQASMLLRLLKEYKGR